MSDNQNGTNPAPIQATPADAGAGGQPGFKAPEGFTLVPQKDWDASKRYREQYEGSRSYWEKGSQLGFKSPDDFGRLERLNSALGKHKLDYDKLANILDTPLPDERPDQYASGVDPEQLAKLGFIKSDDLDKRIARMQAEADHKLAMAEEKRMIEQAKKSVDLSGLTARERKFAEQALASMFSHERRGMYDQSNPLHSDHLQPFTSEYVSKAIEEFKKDLELQQAEDLLEVGKAAATQKPPAGNAGQQGKPKEGQNARDRAAAAMKDRIAKRQGKAP